MYTCLLVFDRKLSGYLHGNELISHTIIDLSES